VLRGGAGLNANAEGRAAGGRELILAIFRLAVADYVGVSYGHDQPVRHRRVQPVYREDAAAFLRSPWADALADLIGLSSAVIWREARRQFDREIAERMRPAA
jgi:hypothetical protein